MIQIICTILTFIGAVLLLGLNQWFIARHKRTDVLSEKLEQLYSTLERIAALGTPANEEDATLDEALKQLRIEAAQALKECKRAALLVALYFPELEARWKEVLKSAEFAFYEMADFKMSTDLNYVWEKKDETRGGIESLLEHLTVEAGSLTKRTF